MSLARRVLPLAACAAVVAGCGGSGGARLTATEYTAQAEKICTDAVAKTKALAQPTKPEQFKPFLQKGIGITQSAIDEFKGLKPPGALEGKHRAVVAAEQVAVDKLQQVTDGLKGDVTDAVRVNKASPELSRLSKDLDVKLVAAGLPKCAKS
jgi:hypothetical protein